MSTRDRSPARASSAHPGVRLLRALARLALFQAGRPPDPRFIPAEPAPSALAWIRCHVFGAHDFRVQCESGRVYLTCRQCGAQSRGWVFEEVPWTARVRFDPGTRASVTVPPARPSATVTAHESAACCPAAAEATPAARRALWTVGRASNSPFSITGQHQGIPGVTMMAVRLDAHAVRASGHFGAHAARDPPASWR
jgi:hypothetical protein